MSIHITMATLVRKSVVNLRNINQCRHICAAIQNKGFEKIWRRKTPHNGHLLLHKWQPFHTTNVFNRIVAFKLSDIGEGIREVAVKEWFVKVGDKVQQFDNICEVQSDKAAVTITSRYDGVVTKLYHDIDKIALVGLPLVDIEVQDGEESETSSDSDVERVQNDTNDKMHSSNERVKVLTTPAVRRIASQFNVDLSAVKPSGKNGRVMKEDVLKHLNISSDKSNEIPSETSRQEPLIDQTTMIKTEDIVPIYYEDKVVPITGFTKAMVKSMTDSMKIPHFVFSDEYDVSKLVNVREDLKSEALDKGVKLTYMPIIIKAASLCLHKYPIINSSLDNNCENVIYKANHNICVAMDTPNGLVVPVIKNVQNKKILDIARDLNNLQERGSKGQLGINDLSGGTFTLSNIGIIGGTYTKPIIFSPQVAIGALGKIQTLPRFDSLGNVIKAHILSVSWAADHRIVDGVTMARFSEALRKYLENPQILLLDL